MDTRNAVPNYLSPELITAANIKQHLPAAAQALDIPLNHLETLFSDNCLAELITNLDYIYQDSINIVKKSIDIEARELDLEDADTLRFFTHKKAGYTAVLNELVQHLKLKQQELIEKQQAAIAKVKQDLTDPKMCHSGNYALQLDTVKRNIAIALQHAACNIHLYWHDVRASPAPFNAIFSGIASIDETGQLKLHHTAMDRLAALSLEQCQEELCRIIRAAREQKNPMLARYINDALAKLPRDRSVLTKKGEAFFDVSTDSFTFTPLAHAVQKLAADAASQANNMLTALTESMAAKIDEFENDATTEDKHHLLRRALKATPGGLIIFRRVASNTNHLSKLIQGDHEDIQELASRLQDFANREPVDSRTETAALLSELRFPAEQRQQIMDGLQEVLQNFHNLFLRKPKIDFMTKHCEGMADQLHSMEAELAECYQSALIQHKPYTEPTERLQQIAEQRQSLLDSLEHCHQKLDKINADYAKVYEHFNFARREFIQYFTDTQHNDWQADLQLRLDAILLDIDDLIKKHSHHPALQGTSLDDVIIDYLRELRERTLATKETLEPDYVPPSLRDTHQPERSFLQRHPALKGLLYAGVGVAGVALLTGTVIGALLLAPLAVTTSALACLAIAAAVTGLGIVAGVVGAFRAILKSGEMAQQVTQYTPIVKQKPSSTLLINQGLGSDDEPSPVVQYYDDSDDEVEIISDYPADHGVVADDSREFAPDRRHQL